MCKSELMVHPLHQFVCTLQQETILLYTINNRVTEFANDSIDILRHSELCHQVSKVSFPVLPV